MEPMIYLFFNGNCLEAMTFYVDLLGGTLGEVIRNADAPDPAYRMPGGDDLVMHTSVQLGQTMLMASDASEGMFERPQGFRVSLSPASLAEFDRIYDGLARDAQGVAMPPGETFFAERFAMVTDRFGTPWMLIFEGNRAQG